MSSKISGDGASSPAQIASVGAGRPVQRSQDAVSGGTTSDSSKDGSPPQNVQITGTARQLADLDQKVRDLPDVNEERVSQLRTAIEQGTYQVRPQHIADQLMLAYSEGVLDGAKLATETMRTTESEIARESFEVPVTDTLSAGLATLTPVLPPVIISSANRKEKHR